MIRTGIAFWRRSGNAVSGRDGGLDALGLAESDLVRLRKLDIRKQVLAWWVRSQTMVGNRWLAQRLRMGDEGSISKAVRDISRSGSPAVLRLKKSLMKNARIPKSGD